MGRYHENWTKGFSLAKARGVNNYFVIGSRLHKVCLKLTSLTYIIGFRDGWMALPRGAMGLSAVSDSDISWSYSLSIFVDF